MASIDETANNFIGRGLVFPITLNSSGRPDIKGGQELLEASIKSIMSFFIGTRFFLGEYGTRLEQLIQEPNDLITQSLVRQLTVDVISQWEKRLELLDVTLESRDEYSLNIRMRYQVKNTKIEGTFVYPYYSQLIY